jgi:hypothetical protein
MVTGAHGALGLKPPHSTVASVAPVVGQDEIRVEVAIVWVDCFTECVPAA